MSRPDRFSVEWFLAGVLAVCAVVLWVVLGIAGDDGVGAMPAWGALVFLVGGRGAVVGVFAAGAYFWACAALQDRWPRVATTLLLLGVEGAIAGAAWLAWTSGWTAVGAFIGWIGALFATLLVPERVGGVVLPVVWFGGAIGGTIAGVRTGHSCGAALAAVLLAFGVWVWVWCVVRGPVIESTTATTRTPSGRSPGSRPAT